MTLTNASPWYDKSTNVLIAQFCCTEQATIMFRVFFLTVLKDKLPLFKFNNQNSQSFHLFAICMFNRSGLRYPDDSCEPRCARFSRASSRV